jgi:hypothetical protein
MTYKKHLERQIATLQVIDDKALTFAKTRSVA